LANLEKYLVEVLVPNNGGIPRVSITLIPVKSTEFVENIKKALHNPVDLEIEIPAGSSVIVAYLKTLVDNAAVLNNILKPLGESSFNSEKSTRCLNYHS